MDEEMKDVPVSRGSAKKGIRRRILKSATGQREIDKDGKRIVYCPCKARYHEIKDLKEELTRRVKIKEDEIRAETEERLQKHLQYLKDRFNNILRNEQIRTSYMLREANRDKQEKIGALKTQLESSNMAALMYVVCRERRRGAVEVAALRDEYAAYVDALEQLMVESQVLIGRLVRGYRTAGSLDREWRGRLRALVEEFVAYIEHFSGPGVEAHCWFDIPRLLEMETPTPVVDEPCPDETVKPASAPEPEERRWWERLGDQPFVVVGDMSELSPGERLGVLREVKAAAKRPAPERWREYAFNDVSLKDTCSQWEEIKRRFKQLRSPHATEDARIDEIKQTSVTSRHQPSHVDYRSRMGSIIRMITSNATGSQVPKTSLLAAKDSLEILSVTKLDELFEERFEDNYNLDEELWESEEIVKEEQENIENYDEDDDGLEPTLGSMAADSMLVIPTHVPDVDRKISTEKVCPELDCRRRRDELVGSLPPYMRAGPATCFDKTFEMYETCTPEQLKILERRIEELKKKERTDALKADNPLDEWADDDDEVVGGGVRGGGGDESAGDKVNPVAVCSCADADEEKIDDIMPVKKLYDIKQEMDKITKEFFFDERIQFDRCQVVGQNGSGIKRTDKPILSQVKELLGEYPSLCGLFEGTGPS